MKGRFLMFVVGLIAPYCFAQVYKYQDANGKWQFSDKKPQHTEAEVLDYKNQETKSVKPDFRLEQRDGVHYLSVRNPFHAPLQLELRSKQLAQGGKEWLIPPLAHIQLMQTKRAIEPYDYRWHLGDPGPVGTQQEYYFPVDSGSCVHISQGFNGRFSHSKDSSRYAVDIATNVGTSIVAARAGVVVQAKDDYHMGGVNEYFLDKANYISVLHPDGTLARYVHILLGSALVKPGDRVQIGQEIAKSGSSGFSSGPHLHFVISRNGGFRDISVPFKFIARDGVRLVPVEGLKMCAPE